MGGGRNRRQASNRQEHKMASVLDQVNEFERFKREILPKLAKMLEQDSTKAEDIYRFAEKYAAAKTVTIALTAGKDSDALSAIKDVLDRVQGKAKERHEHEHKLGKLPEKELDAILNSAIGDVINANSGEESAH